MSTSLPSSLEGLLKSEAYPHPVGDIELVTTHISWVLLAGEYAYKLKRPVCYPFIDLSTLERRRFLCEEELRLNRRFAPQLYLEVCKIVAVNSSAKVELAGPIDGPDVASGSEAILEHAVRMRRFSRDEELDRLLEGQRIEPRELETFGRELAQMHAQLRPAPADSAWGRQEGVRAQLLRNLLECADAAAVFESSGEVLALRNPLQAKLAACASSMAARRSSGMIRECHGDLHSRNIVRLEGRLVAFDCLEYDPTLRWIDTADEVAFLTGDLKARERALHAQAFRSGYLTESGDYHACRVLKLYEAHRALVRAKVAAISAAKSDGTSDTGALQREHARLIATAADALAPKRPLLVLMSGLSGSGKTWLARQLAERLSAVHIRSDVERKRRAGLAELAPSHSRLGEDLYSAGVTAALYDDLALAAEHVLRGGIVTVVDGTFLERAQRVRFAALAGKCGVPLHLIRCEAPEAVLKARITERSRARRDSSEADLGVLAWQMTHAEPLTAEEGVAVTRVDTSLDATLDLTLRSIGRAVSGPLDQT